MKLKTRWLVVVALGACLNHATFVSITPDHGYADGCIDVVLQGHHLGTQASGSVGGTDFLRLDPAVRDPKRPDHAQDVGFMFYGLVPSGAYGWADVELVVDGEKLTLPDGFYYENCPASVQVDAITIPELSSCGDVISLVGCGFGDAVSVNIYEVPTPGQPGIGEGAVPVATMSVALDCGTARAHAVVPAALGAGTYLLEVLHTDGTSYTGECFSDSGDTGLTCPGLVLNHGGAR